MVRQSKKVKDAVNGSALNENQSSNFGQKVFLRSGLNINQGERGGIHWQVNQDITNQTRVPPQDPLFNEMNQHINDEQ